MSLWKVSRDGGGGEPIAARASGDSGRLDRRVRQQNRIAGRGRPRSQSHVEPERQPGRGGDEAEGEQDLQQAQHLQTQQFEQSAGYLQEEVVWFFVRRLEVFSSIFLGCF